MVRLGAAALGFSVLVASKYDFASGLQPLMDRLALRVDETVHAAVLDGRDIIHIARAEPETGPHMAVALGARSPAHATGLGKAILAALPTDDVLRLYPEEELRTLTGNGVRTRSELLRELETTRRRGYAIDNEEARSGVRCVAAPVFESTGTTHLAVSVTSPRENLECDRLRAVAEEVCAVAAELTSALQGEQPEGWPAPWSES